ncbi:hypothetical protein ACFQ0X_01870 [Streptomyces rectiviolaceus]|uniref:Uncharacterized protein n=1 Tax=Streptomyces rectiviolaceus TaxID=332591 RepID=A0ABP6MSF8_9ACTN
MMHHEFQSARQAEILARAARRRVIREAKQAAKAARTGADRASAAERPSGADSRKRYVRTA